MELLRSEFLVRIGDGEREVRLPVEAIGRVAKLLESLSGGHLPDAVKAAISMNGHPEYRLSERRDIAFAIFYIDAAKKGDIPDRAYNKTVAEAFGVDRTTVQNWVRNSDRICANVGRPGTRSLKRRMLQAAKQYRCNRDRPSWLPERRNIAFAIFYIDAAKKGDIPDRAYNKTVADAFEVGSTDVEEWMRNSNEICGNVDRPDLALLKKRMLQAGQRYRFNRTSTKGSAAETT
jgi:hypothetical protein